VRRPRPGPVRQQRRRIAARGERGAGRPGPVLGGVDVHPDRKQFRLVGHGCIRGLGAFAIAWQTRERDSYVTGWVGHPSWRGRSVEASCRVDQSGRV
jgi:hypothetical protein